MAISYKDKERSHKYHFIHTLNKLRICGFKRIYLPRGASLMQLIQAENDGMKMDGLIEVASIRTTKEYLQLVPFKDANYDLSEWPGGAT